VASPPLPPLQAGIGQAKRFSRIRLQFRAHLGAIGRQIPASAYDGMGITLNIPIFTGARGETAHQDGEPAPSHGPNTRQLDRRPRCVGLLQEIDLLKAEEGIDARLPESAHAGNGPHRLSQRRLPPRDLSLMQSRWTARESERLEGSNIAVDGHRRAPTIIGALYVPVCASETRGAS